VRCRPRLFDCVALESLCAELEVPPALICNQPAVVKVMPCQRQAPTCVTASGSSKLRLLTLLCIHSYVDVCASLLARSAGDGWSVPAHKPDAAASCTSQNPPAATFNELPISPPPSVAPSPAKAPPPGDSPGLSPSGPGLDTTAPAPTPGGADSAQSSSALVAGIATSVAVAALAGACLVALYVIRRKRRRQRAPDNEALGWKPTGVANDHDDAVKLVTPQRGSSEPDQHLQSTVFPKDGVAGAQHEIEGAAAAASDARLHLPDVTPTATSPGGHEQAHSNHHQPRSRHLLPWRCSRSRQPRATVRDEPPSCSLLHMNHSQAACSD
jgi:hypothetical protein